MQNQNASQIVNLIYEASDRPEKEILDTIMSLLAFRPENAIPELLPHFDLLLDSWGTSVEESSAKASFCLDLASNSQLNTSVSLRNALVLAARHFVPDFLSKAESVKLSTARDNSLPLIQIAGKIKNISRLSDNICAYVLNSNEWVEKKSVDSITHQVEIMELKTSRKKNMSLDVFISDSIFFDFHRDEILKRIEPKDSFSFFQWRDFLLTTALTKPNDEQIRKISLNTFIPNKMTASEFLLWIDGITPSSPSFSSGKHPATARGLDEMHAILVEIQKTSGKIHVGEDDSKNIAIVLEKTFKSGEENSKLRIITEIFAILLDSLEDDDSRKNVLSSFDACAEKIFPKDIGRMAYIMELWAEFPALNLKILCEALRDMRGADFFAKFAQEMPIKALNASAGLIPEEQIIEAATAKPHADIILWAWKNRKKNLATKKLLSIAKIFSALAEKSTSKFRNNSSREIKKLLLSNNDFIDLIAQMAVDENAEVLRYIDDDKILIPAEKQSLIVKLSRARPELKKYIEQEHERGGMRLSKTLSDNRKNLQYRPVSIKSFNAKLRELQDIKTKQIPENIAAIAHARGYGDLRENAEYSAAKERQKFLNRRKFEIEKDLDSITPTIFNSDEKDENIVKPGRSIVLNKTLSSEEITYLILGAWDGDPDRNMLSSESELAKSLLEKTQNDTVSLHGVEYLIRKVSFLPKEILKELNEEQA